MSQNFKIRYDFSLPDETVKTFIVDVDGKSIRSNIKYQLSSPDWCKLEFHQCPHCPMKAEEAEFCPLAQDLVEIVDDFGKILSFEEVKVRVTTSERTVLKRTDAQVGLSSLMGLYIAVSSCPLTDFFKPMARFHLPFATFDETLWRAASTYLLSQYFNHHEGADVDMTMAGLSQIYKDVQKLNNAVASRLKASCDKDSPINALVSLDMFAQCFPLVIEDALTDIEYLFKL